MGIQTADLENCLAWYRDFFGAEPNWSLDRFSELTLSRLPGIRRLVEVEAGGVRFHLFDRDGHTRTLPDGWGTLFQHVCVEVDSPAELHEVRERWIELFRSGRYAFARPDGPTDIVTDAEGVQSLYVLDVNGLEFEFTYIPGGD
ncbi:VOC family protein [Actinomadura craniellae]|uniref:VOC family protein n=1 Tax=Actinomadura craniellae TaxID=2231787 RepID=A0A365H0Z4_9ACTN|nr:VOC family protein [Actinomadura craniellae]